MGGAVPPLPNTPSWRGAQPGGEQGQFKKMNLITFGEAYTLRISSVKHLPYRKVDIHEIHNSFRLKCLLNKLFTDNI
jgi:hypothetical protein